MKTTKYIILTIVVCCVGCRTTRITHGIPNLAQVEPGVWRGGQPSDEGWKWLKTQGVTYDVKLNTWSEASDLSAFTNGIFVQDDGVIDLQQQLFKPNSYAVSCAIQSILNKPSHPGIFVHCQHGQDRTGLVVALYRLSEGWTKSAAEKEMLAHGFHKELLGLWHYWKNYEP